jgi:nucleoside-diphosphate-sugar epimerase
VKKKEKVLVLGGNGFIGTHLISKLSENFEIITFNRTEHSFAETISKDFPDFVINCSASNANAEPIESFEANIEFQMECLKLLLNSGRQTFKWVQIASYFELQISFGRRDNYSLDKQICRSLLHRIEESHHIKLTTIFLPHIFGEGENANRFIPYTTKALQNGHIAEISQGEQFLPILGVEDCCSAIGAAILTDQLICSATPIWYDRVNRLAFMMENAISRGVVKINLERESIDNSFPRVEFPPTVKNWTPKMSFNDFLSQLPLNEMKI